MSTTHLSHFLPSRVLSVDLEVKNGKAERVRVNMGTPILKSADIPTTLPGDRSVHRRVGVGVNLKSPVTDDT